MQLHDFPGDAQPQAKMAFVRSGGVAGVEALKYLPLLGIRDTGAMVGDEERKLLWQHPGPHLDCLPGGGIGDGISLFPTLRANPRDTLARMEG